MAAYCIPVGTFHAGWDGEVIGGSRGEYAVQSQEGGAPISGTTLFCFMARLPGSSEQGLEQEAITNKGSIFACDGHAVYDSYVADLVNEGNWKSFANTQQFVKVWKHVLGHAVYKAYDWTVKVDPDTVFLPARLKVHLESLRPPADKPIYIKNCAVYNGFLGAIEIVSRVAMESFAAGYLDCQRTMPGRAGEDGWLKGCLDAVGAGYMTDVNILKSPNDPECTDGNRVAFHPHKVIGEWSACWATATRSGSDRFRLPR